LKGKLCGPAGVFTGEYAGKFADGRDAGDVQTFVNASALFLPNMETQFISMWNICKYELFVIQ
jgi:hypothetical protein